MNMVYFSSYCYQDWIRSRVRRALTLARSIPKLKNPNPLAFYITLTSNPDCCTFTHFSKPALIAVMVLVFIAVNC